MMNFKRHIPTALVCFLAASCGSSNQKAELTSGIDLQSLDTSVAPGTSFYQYACGGWMANNPLPKEFARFGTFDLLAENNREQVKVLIEELSKTEHAEGSVEQKIGDLYAIAMNADKLNKDGAAPIATELKRIDALKNSKEISLLLTDFNKKGIFPYFALYVGADEMNSSQNIVHSHQYGLGLGQKDYYVNNDEATKKIREAYQNHIQKMFVLAGDSEKAAAQAAKDVMEVEGKLADKFSFAVELRDPHANYNITSIADLKKTYPAIDWGVYLNNLGMGAVESIDLGQPKAMKEVNNLLANLPLSKHQSYLKWKLIDASASYLSDAFVDQNFEFYGKVLSGTEENQPRWKRAVSSVNSTLGEAVGQIYVQKHFPPQAKERMVDLVANLQKALGERIQELEWMSDVTKAKAQEKLSTFHVKIGYPDKWKDYSTLPIENDSYWGNIKRAANWEHQEMIAKIGKPVDADEWFMTPQTVNAYYNPTTNEICFPAGILQYPFFDMNADDAFNYGAIGVVIGHEMTHGFDDQGRQYDKDGNLNDWWTAEDAKNFSARAQVMVDFFNAIEVAPGVHANGQFTLGENIADHGGLQVSYQAFKNATKDAPLAEKDGFTPEQRFFLAYANVWAGNIRPEEILDRTKSDPHSLGQWRVDAALPQIASWYEAFKITPEDALFVPEKDRVSIW